MSIPYDTNYKPPAPVISVRLSAPSESPRGNTFLAMIDTGSDGTFIPLAYLEEIEAIEVGDAMLHGILGETYAVHLYEVDLHMHALTLPNIVVATHEQGHEAIIGRNVLNKLVLLLDGRQQATDIFEQRPKRL